MDLICVGDGRRRDGLEYSENFWDSKSSQLNKRYPHFWSFLIMLGLFLNFPHCLKILLSIWYWSKLFKCKVKSCIIFPELSGLEKVRFLKTFYSNFLCHIFKKTGLSGMFTPKFHKYNLSFPSIWVGKIKNCLYLSYLYHKKLKLKPQRFLNFCYKTWKNAFLTVE